MSGFNDLYKLMQRQTDSLSEMPNALGDLRQAVRSASDTIAASKETVASAQRSAVRVESVIDELEQPFRSLKESIDRLNAVIGHPAVQRLPETIESIEAALLPLVATLNRLQERSSRLGARVRGARDTARALVPGHRHAPVPEPLPEPLPDDGDDEGDRDAT